MYTTYYQPTTSANHAFTPSIMEDIVLPPLSLDDIDKLDHLISFMKENKTEYIHIYEFCKKKWGDNKLLYLFFAEYLKKNSFTIVQNHKNGQEYTWKQMILPGGLEIGSFRKEYLRQQKKRKKQISDESSNPLNSLANLARKIFFIISFSVSCLYAMHLFYAGNKSGMLNKQQELATDSLQYESEKTWNATVYTPLSVR